MRGTSSTAAGAARPAHPSAPGFGQAADDHRRWAGKLARYRKPSLARSSTELAVTAVPFLALWLLMWLSLGLGYWLTLILAVPAAGFLVRLFMIQHDCGHRSEER